MKLHFKRKEKCFKRHCKVDICKNNIVVNSQISIFSRTQKQNQSTNIWYLIHPNNFVIHFSVHKLHNCLVLANMISFGFLLHLPTPILCAKEWITLAEERELGDGDSPVTATLYLFSQKLLALIHILRGKLVEGLEIREENETWISVLLSLR